MIENLRHYIYKLFAENSFDKKIKYNLCMNKYGSVVLYALLKRDQLKT